MMTGSVVTAKRTIEQSPLDGAPAIRRGTQGHVEDEADDYLWVDFGEPFGVVACEESEVCG